MPSGTGNKQSVPSPMGHSPRGAGNRAHQQLPTRQEINIILGTTHGFSQEQKKMEPETRLEISYSVGARAIQAAGQEAHLQHSSKQDNVPHPEHKWCRTTHMVSRRSQVQEVRAIKDYYYSEGSDTTNYLPLVAKRL